MNVESVIDKCIGCGNCKNVCNQEAVRLSANRKGFLQPEIKSSKCNDCGLCLLKCPAAQNQEINSKVFSEQVFAAWASDREVLKKSSSGGIFYLIARSIIKNGGYVCGAVYSEDFHKVKHIISNTESDLQRMRGSKYSQSDLGDVLPKMKSALLEGKNVLFSGTPCEVEASKLFLGKEYCNFYTVSLICHGPIAPIILDTYISDKEKEHGSIVSFYSMRHKNKGKSIPLFYRMEFENEDCEEGDFYDSMYGQVFSSNLAMRDACYNCAYKRRPYSGDIILGDFKGIEYTTLRDNKAGVSAVIVNSEKGKMLWETIKPFVYYQESELEVVEKLNHRLCCPVEKPAQSSIYKFWEVYEKEGISAAAKMVCKNKSFWKRATITLKSAILKTIKRIKVLFARCKKYNDNTRNRQDG